MSKKLSINYKNNQVTVPLSGDSDSLEISSATPDTSGVIKIGHNLYMDKDGVLHSNAGDDYTIKVENANFNFGNGAGGNGLAVPLDQSSTVNFKLGMDEHGMYIITNDD